MVEIMRRPRIIRETARGLETMSLEDDFFQKREIFLTTGIEAEVSTELIKQLLYLNSMDPMKEITLYINSPGGEIKRNVPESGRISYRRYRARKKCCVCTY